MYAKYAKFIYCMNSHTLFVKLDTFITMHDGVLNSQLKLNCAIYVLYRRSGTFRDISVTTNDM